MRTPARAPGAFIGVPRATAAWSVPPMSDQEYDRFRALVLERSGIHLGPAKKPLLVGRLARILRQEQIESFAQYFRRVRDGGEAEIVRLLDAVATNETRFFREPRHFEYLENVLCPQWKREGTAGRRAREVRAWSAGCSTGEEPYSLAMVLTTQFGEGSGWHVEVVGTDISTRALAQAREGSWRADRAAGIPSRFARAYMQHGTGSETDRVIAGPELRRVLRFGRVNLHDRQYPATLGTFDVIFCRNVMIYFTSELRARVAAQLLQHLRPGGLLFLGHAETLVERVPATRRLMPAVYQRLPRP